MSVLTKPVSRRSDAPPAGGGPSGDGAGDRGRPRRGWPAGLAVLVTAALAALLTYVGMLTQIWANLAGSQLPGA